MSDLKAQITLSADATGVETGVGKAKRSLKDLGGTAAGEGKRAADGLDRIGTATGRAARAIDSAVAKLQLQAKTIGQTSTEAALFELRQKGASRAQLDAAAAALKTVDAHKAQEAAMQRASNVAGKLGAMLATISLGAQVALAAALRSAVNDLDAFNDLKDATGASIETISALDRVARETGGTFDQVSSILTKFNQALKDVDSNKRVGAVFKALNLDAAALQKLDPAEALRQTAVAFSAFADDGNKARAAQELFGRSVREVAPLLKDLSEKNELVASTTAEAAEEAEKFGKNMARFRANVDDAARSLASGFLPVLNRMIEDVGSFGKKASLAGLAGDVIKFKKELDALESRKGNPFNFAGNLDAQIAEAQNRLESARARFNAADVDRPKPVGGGRGFVNPAAASTLPSLELPNDPKEPKGPKGDPLAEAKRYLESLQKQVEKTRDLTVYEQALADISQKRLGKLTPDLEKSILATSQQVDVAQAAKAALEGMTTARQRALEMQERFDSTALASVAQQIEGNQALREEIEMLGLNVAARTAVEQARLSSAVALKEEELLMARNADASATQISALEREIELLKERASLLGARGQRQVEIEDKEKSKEFAKELNTDLKRAFSDALMDTKNPLKAFGDALYSTVASRVAAALAQSMADNVLKAVGQGAGGTGGWAGLISSIFGGVTKNALGGVYNSAGLSAYSGSVVSKPTVFPFAKGAGLMGEAGPEAILPLRRGTDGKLGVEAGGGGGVSLTIINNGAPVDGKIVSKGTAPDGSQLLELVLNAAADGVANRSGPLSRALESGYGLRPVVG